MPSLTSREKRQARIITLQAIYAHELKGSNLDDTFKYMMDSGNLPSKDIITYSNKRVFIINR